MYITKFLHVKIPHYTVYEFVNFSEDKKEVRMDKDNNLGLKIRQLRKARGLTQEQLAEKLDIDNKHLSKIEKGDHKPTYKLILKLAEVLQINIYDFSGLDVKPETDQTYLKSLKILNSAKNSKEKEYYLEALKHAQKGLKIGKSSAFS